MGEIGWVILIGGFFIWAMKGFKEPGKVNKRMLVSEKHSFVVGFVVIFLIIIVASNISLKEMV